MSKKNSTKSKKSLYPNTPYVELNDLTQLEDEKSFPIIEGILHENNYVLLHGFKETYKTWLAGTMAICVASKTPFFGHKVLKPGKVIYVYGEGQMIKRLKKICRGLSIPFPKNLIPFKLRANLSNPEELKRFKSRIPEDTALIIMDNYEKFFHSSIDGKIVSQAMDLMRETRELTTIVLVQHQSKSSSKKASGHGNAIGNVEIINSADSTVELNNIGKGKARKIKVSFYSRDEASTDTFCFSLKQINKDSLLLERSDTSSQDEVGNPTEDIQYKTHVSMAIELLPNFKTLNLTKTGICDKLRQKLGIRDATVFAIFEELVHLGMIKHKPRGKCDILPIASGK